MLSHSQALDAICGCAATVTVLSYEEAIGAYFKLRGYDEPDPLARLEAENTRLKKLATDAIDLNRQPPLMMKKATDA